MSINITSGIGDIANLVGSVIDRIWPSKTQEDAQKFDLLKAQITSSLAGQMAQLQVDKAAETSQGFTFRDGAGWVCVAAFALSALRAPLEWLAALAGHPVVLPAIDTNTTGSMLAALLGLGGMHLYQKVTNK